MTSDRVILNWVEENTKSFKKVFPVLKYLEDDDIIIDIDDDLLLPRDFIESRLDDFKYACSEHPISSNLYKSINMDNNVVQCYSIFQKRMLANWERFVDDTVLKTCNDDRTYLYLFHMNGFKVLPCSNYCVGFPSSPSVKPIGCIPKSGYRYLVGSDYDKAVAGAVSKLSGGKPIGECFGLFSTQRTANAKDEPKKEVGDGGKKKRDIFDVRPETDPDTARLFQFGLKRRIKHDLVYVLGKGSKYKNLEIKISITSMLKFCSHWIGDIYVVGENPGIHNPKVKHIYAPDITKANKDANIIHKLLTAIQKIPSLTENFLFCSDDILVTKKTDWDDFAPRYVFEYKQSEEARKLLYDEARNNPWDILMLKTRDRFWGNREHIYFYEPHIFAPINKRYFRQMCGLVDYTSSKDVIIMSLWFNWLDLRNPARRFDHQSVFTDKVPDMDRPLQRHLTYNDKAFGVKKFRDGLIELVTMDEFKDGNN